MECVCGSWEEGLGGILLLYRVLDNAMECVVHG